MTFNIRSVKRKGIAATAGMGLALVTTGPVFADDTEIFTGQVTTSANANVVFILDTSGSMGDRPSNANEQRTKIQIVKDVFKNLIFDPQNPDSVNPDTEGLNLALMRFNQNNGSSDSGGRFITQMRQLNNGSVNYFWDRVNGSNNIEGLTADGWTPLAETAFEASRYFSGLSPVYGADSSDQGIFKGNTYKSPFKNTKDGQCAIRNHLVILTDGMPTRDGDADTNINNLEHSGENCRFSDANETDCLPNVAKHLHDNDFLPDTDVVDNVITHTIAFDLEQTTAVQLLKDTATNGGGRFFSASTASQLSDSISDVLTTVVESAQTLVSPATSVSSSNRFVHDNNLYFALFKPDVKPQWMGNLKGYFLNENDDGSIELQDQNGSPALNDLGGFATGISSKWSTTNDGDDISAGGAAEQILNQTSRNIYTQNSANPENPNLVALATENVSTTDLGMENATQAEVNALINWARSRDSNPIGDPLHSNPQVINYGGDNGSIIVFGTNEGLLHAIDTETGQERVAFIPKVLLGNLKQLRDGVAGESHPYGMDGQLSVLVRDADQDGEIETNNDDQVIVIAGMRRGGGNYYALDITNPNAAPTLLWQITGGSENFPKLGQSWSRALITKIKTGSVDEPTVKDVAIFTGGNDTQYDDGSVPAEA
ncbi:MAG: PilC/PilY family type IV pilus protein, partial [Gammaproteobacteria bacterium]